MEWREDLQQLMVDLHTSPYFTPTQSTDMNIVQRNGRNSLHVHISNSGLVTIDRELTAVGG